MGRAVGHRWNRHPGSRWNCGRHRQAEHIDIVAALGAGSIYAAQLCDGLTVGGFSDWFLPSKDELNLMYTNLHSRGLGGFQPNDYWSSSETDANDARTQYFKDGSQSIANYKYNTFRVRAVRAF